MPIKVKVEYSSGDPERCRDSLKFTVHATHQFYRQMAAGLTPVKFAWHAYGHGYGDLKPAYILVTVRQYIDNVSTAEKTFSFNQADSYEVRMSPVIELVRRWLRPQIHKCTCSVCSRPFRSYDARDTVCRPCIKAGHELVQIVSGTGDRGKARKAPARAEELYSCTCLLCDRPFLSKDPKAIKCKACTIPESEKRGIRAAKEAERQARRSRREAISRVSTDKFC